MTVRNKIEPSKEDVDVARRIRAAIRSGGRRTRDEKPLRLGGVKLTAKTREAFEKVLEEFAEGNAVVVEGSRQVSEYTSTRAAAELGMSRPTLINLLEEGEMSYRMVGTHRRIPRAEVERYKGKMRRERKPAPESERAAALREMARTTAGTGDGY